MDISSDESRTPLLKTIREGIQKSDQQSSALKKKNSRYIVVSIFASALSTVVAGATAAIGPLIGQGPSAWKLTCGAIALCTGVATVFTGLQKQLSIAEHLAKAIACSGKLHSLEFGLTINNRGTSEVAKEYENIIAVYPEILL